MSTIAGKGSENNNPNVRHYRGCGYDGNDYDEEDCFCAEGTISRAYGFYKNGIWYPPGQVATPPAPEITYTEEELKELKKCYRSEKTIVKLLSERSGETLRFFKYVDYINQEFKKLQKRYDETQEEVDRLRRMFANYYIFVNGKEYYLLEYGMWENGHSVYITKRVGLKRGDIITGYSCTTQAHFPFKGGMILEEGLSEKDFEKLPRGLMCKTDGIYNIEVILDYDNDVVRVRPATNEYSKFDLAKQEYMDASKSLLAFMKSIEKLYEKLSNIIDRGSKIDPENLGEALKRWQCLDRIVEYEIYQPYEKKVARYGTSY